jgi:hypothetical protein
MREKALALAVACLVVSGGIMAATPASAATDTEILVRDFKTYHKRCDHVAESDAAMARKCADEKTGLVQRQQKLGISDEKLNEMMNPLGELRGGNR